MCFIISTLKNDTISRKIFDLLLESGIKRSEMLNVLHVVSQDIEEELWERAPISLPLFYSLKDVIWYNLEHLPSGGEQKGRTTLKRMGSKYPNFVLLDTVFIEPNDVRLILKELEDIRKQWSNDFYYVSLTSKSGDFSSNPESPANVIIYDSQTEKPSKYGYNPYSSINSGIISEKGDKLNSSDDIVLCSIESKLGTYGHEPLMRSLLEKLIETCKKSLNFEKGVLLDVNGYDYTT